MNALAPIAPRLARLIPLLGSDKHGEVVAAARAVGRTLASASADWHDLASALAPEPIAFDDNPPAYSSPPREPRRWTNWTRLREHERVIALDLIMDLKLSPWEKQFSRSRSEILRGNPHINLSQKQIDVLNRLLARVGGQP